MKALLKKASNWEYKKIIEIKNLEDLLKIDDRLIIEKDEYSMYALKKYGNVKDKEFEIIVTIYDDYVE